MAWGHRHGAHMLTVIHFPKHLSLGILSLMLNLAGPAVGFVAREPCLILSLCSSLWIFSRPLAVLFIPNISKIFWKCALFLCPEGKTQQPCVTAELTWLAVQGQKDWLSSLWVLSSWVQQRMGNRAEKGQPGWRGRAALYWREGSTWGNLSGAVLPAESERWTVAAGLVCRVLSRSAVSDSLPPHRL